MTNCLNEEEETSEHRILYVDRRSERIQNGVYVESLATAVKCRDATTIFPIIQLLSI